jgi:ABC-type multidrug transport system fused ATPase/permease subunit
VGPTGAGKTTLADVILGLLPPTDGVLLVDGIEVTTKNLREWQNIIGYVPQQIYLIDDTIAKNIAFGLIDSEIDQNRIIEAAKIANIHDFIETELPIGYKTVVGERGIRLSGGQRQRIGIARALYHDPELLVMDEATSSLDGITEKSFIDALKNLSRVKTLVIIAHRFSTIMNCDVIYLIDKGRIIDHGSYDQLMRTNKQFQALASNLAQNNNYDAI